MTASEATPAEVLSTPERTVSTRVDYRPALKYLMVACAAALYLLFFVRALSDSGDEGVSVLNAARLLHGDLPARDFLEVNAPGEFFWLALFFRLFGTTIGVAHGELLLAGVALAVLAFHIARRVGANPVLSSALVTAVTIPMFPLNSYHWDGDVLALLSLTVVVEWQRRRSTWLLAAAGVFAGLTALIMQQKGFLLCAAILTSVILVSRAGRRRALAHISIPFLAVILACVGFYAALGALHDLIWANLIWPASSYSNVNICAYGFLLDAYVNSPLKCFLYLPLLFVVALPVLLLLAAFLLRAKVLNVRLIPFWMCGVALFASELRRPDIYHLAFGCPILVILALALWRMLLAPRWASILITACVAVFAMAMALGSLGADKRIETRRGTIYARTTHPEIEFLQAHTRPGDFAFVYPYHPILNFLSGTRNPTRFSYFVYGLQTPEQFREAVRDLERKQVRYALIDTVRTADVMGVLPHYRAPAHDKQIMERYLETRYRQIGFENGYRILERIQ